MILKSQETTISNLAKQLPVLWQHYETYLVRINKISCASLGRIISLCLIELTDKITCDQLLHIVVDNIERPKPRDCFDIYSYNASAHSDGVYTLYLGWSQRPVDVYCDMTTDGGGWTVCTIKYYKSVITG